MVLIPALLDLWSTFVIVGGTPNYSATKRKDVLRRSGKHLTNLARFLPQIILRLEQTYLRDSTGLSRGWTVLYPVQRYGTAFLKKELNSGC